MLTLANTANEITDSHFRSASATISKEPVNIGIAKDAAFVSIMKTIWNCSQNWAQI
ncbi:MAG: hypothetical protein ACLSCV_04340 [Acutalibacteraceae bacterium]